MEDMGRKQYLFLGLAVVLVGLAVAGGMLWVKLGLGKERQELSRGDQAEIVKTRVVSWQPETATLVYRDEQGPEQTVVIQPLKPVVIVPVYEKGKFVKEDLALTKEALQWQTAFCPGDELELTIGEDGKLATIRNRGLRQCAR